MRFLPEIRSGFNISKTPLDLMAFQAYSVSKGMRVGAAGGVTASLVTGLLSILGQRSQGQEEFFVTIARNMGLGDISVAGAGDFTSSQGLSQEQSF